jgi:branched-chain amino acid transport system substrate-binding protein
MKTQNYLSNFKSVMIFVVITMLIMTACAPKSEGEKITEASEVTESPDKEPYRIGVILALSGSVAANGVPASEGIKVAQEELNGNGGINGHPVEFIIRDDASSPDQAATVATELINSGVIGIFGGSFGSDANSIGGFLESTDCALLTPTGLSTVEQKEYKNSFFMMPSTYYMGVGIGYFLDEHTDVEKVGILRLSRDFGQQAAAGLAAAAEERGLEIVAEEQGTDEDLDFTIQLTKLREANPDAIAVFFANPAGATILRQAKELGIEVPLLSAVAMANQPTIDLAGEAAEGLIAEGYLVSTDPLPRQKSFIEVFTEKTGALPATGFQAMGYDAAMVFVKAIESINGTVDCLLVRNAIENMSYEGASGLFNYSPEYHEPDLAGLIYMKVENGKWVMYK